MTFYVDDEWISDEPQEILSYRFGGHLVEVGKIYKVCPKSGGKNKGRIFKLLEYGVDKIENPVAARVLFLDTSRESTISTWGIVHIKKLY